MPVINMLNAKYFIMPLQDNKTMPIRNPYAMGNGWFVKDVKFVENANQELDALSSLNLHDSAVSDKRFEGILKAGAAQTDTTATVKLTKYEPNELHYDISSKTGGVVVFSEIYYPGWTCTVDGQPTEVGRVNYVLRAIAVQPGSHKVMMEFRPKSITTTETVAYVAMALLLVSVCVPIGLRFRKK